MALEAVVFPNDIFGHTMKELQNIMQVGAWSYDEFSGGLTIEYENNLALQIQQCVDEGHAVVHGNWNTSCSNCVAKIFDDWEHLKSSSVEIAVKEEAVVSDVEAVAGRRKRRRRMKSLKNKEEVESQRMAHIAVERNRRKQMNEYLAVLRSIMPASYVPRGDQASIIGGAINYVKDLEQLVQSLEAEKRTKQKSDAAPFADFFTFPQYSSTSLQCTSTATNNVKTESNKSSVADIEVTMVETHANLKVLTRQRPKQLLQMVVGLQNLWLTTLYLNVTATDEMVLYSFSLKVEDGCTLTSVDEIATAVHEMVGKIKEEAAFK